MPLFLRNSCNSDFTRDDKFTLKSFFLLAFLAITIMVYIESKILYNYYYIALICFKFNFGKMETYNICIPCTNTYMYRITCISIYFLYILLIPYTHGLKMGTAIKMLQHQVLQHCVATLRKILQLSAIVRNPQLSAMSAIIFNIRNCPQCPQLLQYPQFHMISKIYIPTN